jgi:N-acetylmuramoyl-L-alanine amidase
MRFLPVAACFLLVGLAPCGAIHPTGVPVADAPIAQTPATAERPPAVQVTAETTKPLSGKVIVVDPGHAGKYKASFHARQVPAGNGKKKACNLSGTATNSGYSEHKYNWDQAKRLAKKLRELGAKVLLTRKDDSSLGLCVDKRAQVANDAKADLLISIHADGNHSKGARGFHVIVSTTMKGGSKLEKQSLALAKYARSELGKLTKMPRSTYIGSGTALSKRSDIATLNLLKHTPGIMMEMGNMRHGTDAKLLKSAKFREAAAQALANAAVRTLT